MKRRILEVAVDTLTKENLELEVANAISRYHRDQQGRAPGRIKASVTGNLIVVVTSEIYTPSEQQLSLHDDGRKAIKSARRELRSLTRDHAHSAIAGSCGCPVLRSYWDLDVRVGEQVEVYILAEDLDLRLSGTR